MLLSLFSRVSNWILLAQRFPWANHLQLGRDGGLWNTNMALYWKPGLALGDVLQKGRRWQSLLCNDGIAVLSHGQCPRSTVTLGACMPWSSPYLVLCCNTHIFLQEVQTGLRSCIFYKLPGDVAVAVQGLHSDLKALQECYIATF